MINRFIWAALCLFSAAGTLAQMRVEISFEQETFLPQEPLYVIVQISNSSGQTLELGKDNDWLSFTVESVDGRPVKQLKPADVEGAFVLPSANRAKKMVNLAEAYDLSQFGRYNVTAMVRIPQWGETFVSGTRHVGISSGVPLWEGVFGLPSKDTDERPELRKYQLVQANHLKQLSLYARIVDTTDQETFAIFPLGRLVGVSRPEAQIDRWSNLHVFYQDGARTFRYHLITPDGLVLARQSWAMTESRPALKHDKDGRIAVAGGIRRVSATDLPPPDLLSERTTIPAADRATPKPVDAVEPQKK